MDPQELIKKAYENFNNRNIDKVFETMNPDVDWPNGWEGGYVKGYDAIRDYWTRQWAAINPNVQPLCFKVLEDGRLEVQVHQTVKSQEGELIFDGYLKHTYTFKDGLIQKMEIQIPENK
jgi:nuclear transport factor 2 (NTF2) superfamily protein